MKFLNFFFYFCGSFLPSCIQIRIPNPLTWWIPDPDPKHCSWAWFFSLLYLYRIRTVRRWPSSTCTCTSPARSRTKPSSSVSSIRYLIIDWLPLHFIVGRRLQLIDWLQYYLIGRFFIFSTQLCNSSRDSSVYCCVQNRYGTVVIQSDMCEI